MTKSTSRNRLATETRLRATTAFTGFRSTRREIFAGTACLAISSLHSRPCICPKPDIEGSFERRARHEQQFHQD